MKQIYYDSLPHLFLLLLILHAHSHDLPWHGGKVAVLFALMRCRSILRRLWHLKGFPIPAILDVTFVAESRLIDGSHNVVNFWETNRSEVVEMTVIGAAFFLCRAGPITVLSKSFHT